MTDEHVGTPRRVTRRFSVEDRKQLVEQFKGSGLTARAFCAQVGIHPTTLSGWMRQGKAATMGFSEVTVSLPSPAPIEVDLPNGVRIRVRTTGDVSRTAELIRAVAAPLGGRGC